MAIPVHFLSASTPKKMDIGFCFSRSPGRAGARTRRTTVAVVLLILSSIIALVPLPVLAQNTLPIQAQHAPNPVPERKPLNLFRGTSAKDWAAFREHCQKLADKNTYHPPLNAADTSAWRDCITPLDLTARHMSLEVHGKQNAH